MMKKKQITLIEKAKKASSISIKKLESVNMATGILSQNTGISKMPEKKKSLNVTFQVSADLPKNQGRRASIHNKGRRNKESLAEQHRIRQ